MKKKFVTGALLLAFGAVAVTSGTLAYFTDEDYAENTMTTGKVAIVQYEKEKNGSDFQPNKALMPMVDARTNKTQNPVVEDPATGKWFDSELRNVVDKVITVKNEAALGAINQDAYVRTIIAFETATEYAAGTNTVLRDGKTIFNTYIGHLGDFELLNRAPVTINGVQYVLALKVYDTELGPGEETTPSLKQFFLSDKANNEVELLFGNEYTILALSQGVQTAGFDTAEEALNTAFGDLETVPDATIVGWFNKYVTTP